MPLGDLCVKFCWLRDENELESQGMHRVNLRSWCQAVFHGGCTSLPPRNSVGSFQLLHLHACIYYCESFKFSPFSRV